MKIALICTGLGRVRRGFETATAELFHQLKGRTDVTLYKGGGSSSEEEVCVWNIPRSALKGFVNDDRAYRYEQLSLAAGLIPFLLTNRPDVVHYSDGALGNAIARLRNLLSLRFVMVLWNGAPFSPQHIASCDFIQQVSPVEYQKAIDYGIPASRMKLLPYGLDCARFTAASNRSATLRHYGIPEDRKVILSVAAINVSHKRLDFLINEVSQLDPRKYFLVITGQRTEETAAVERLAQEKLPNGYAILSLPHSDMPELYQAADVMVLCSLNEGLGMVLLEAMASSTPVLAHGGEIFRWVIGSPDSLVDMQKTGALASRIRKVFDDPTETNAVVAKNIANVRQRFDWDVLRSQYLGLYEQAYRQQNQQTI
jgi:1,2-diacylglycerol 3-alpha-glucosyltransferase